MGDGEMKGKKWLPALSALVMIVGITAGGGSAFAKEKHKDVNVAFVVHLVTLQGHINCI